MIAEALAASLDAETLSRIAGPLGEAARDRQRELARLDEGARRARRAAWLASARVAVPPSLRGVDGSWIEHAIATVAGGHAALAARVRRVLAEGAAAPGDVWLARWACAALPPMAAVDERIVRPRTMTEALATSAPVLRAWLEEVGADTIAFAVGRSAVSLSTRLGAAAARIALAPRAGEMGDRRAAIERARMPLDEGALLRVGARTIAPYASALERMQLAHRLPRDAQVWPELEAFAGSAGSPSWRALAAA